MEERRLIEVVANESHNYYIKHAMTNSKDVKRLGGLAFDLSLIAQDLSKDEHATTASQKYVQDLSIIVGYLKKWVKVQ